MPRLRQLLGAVALLMGAAAPTALSPAPVHAAGACTPQGVTVVVDFGALGGGVQQSCASSGGNAAALFGAAGHKLGRVQSQPSAVCTVDGKAEANGKSVTVCPHMPPANAYWGLFWTDGSSSRWTYASLGVDSLDVPAGGSVAFAWQSSAGTRSPGVAPVVTKTAAPAAKPTKASKQSKPRSAKTGGKSTKNPATTPSATPTPTAGPTAGPSVSAGVSPSSVAAASPTAKAKKKRAHASAPTTGSGLPSAPTASSTSANSATISTDSTPISANSGSGGLPGWVAPVVVVVVLAAGGGVAVVRRRARG